MELRGVERENYIKNGFNDLKKKKQFQPEFGYLVISQLKLTHSSSLCGAQGVQVIERK